MTEREELARLLCRLDAEFDDSAWEMFLDDADVVLSAGFRKLVADDAMVARASYAYECTGVFTREPAMRAALEAALSPEAKP